MNRMTSEDFKAGVSEICERALLASRALAKMSTADKNACLLAMADAVEAGAKVILDANEKDIDGGVKKGLAPAMLDRLRLDGKRVKAMADGLREVARLEDPVGRVLADWVRPNGLQIKKVSVPIGVIAIIYEARPNVTVDSAGLCLKSGNATVLRGGSESIHSNIAIAHCVNRSCIPLGLPEGAIQILPWTDREAVRQLLKMDRYVNLVIPRGGESLIRAVVEESTIPVIKHYKGVCMIYVDKSFDMDTALRVVENAKCQRPGVCNAAETLLVHQAVADSFVPEVCAKLISRGVEIRGDPQVCRLVPTARPATEEDWSTEFMELKMAVGVVPDLDSAIAHINQYGSGHSDCVITTDSQAADRFLKEVDSATVYHNASTRFTDGYEFGLGAEIGISTDKLHARGPMGLNELNTYKYLIYGDGQIRT